MQYIQKVDQSKYKEGRLIKKQWFLWVLVYPMQFISYLEYSSSKAIKSKLIYGTNRNYLFLIALKRKLISIYNESFLSYIKNCLILTKVLWEVSTLHLYHVTCYISYYLSNISPHDMTNYVAANWLAGQPITKLLHHCFSQIMF